MLYGRDIAYRLERPAVDARDLGVEEPAVPINVIRQGQTGDKSNYFDIGLSPNGT
jgi:hypothetical protein